jgi:hypothetical protein
MLMLLSFLLLIFIAGTNAYFARQRGRDPVGWFLIGLLLGAFGLLILFVMPKKKWEADLEQDEDRILAGVNDAEENFTFKEWFYLDADHCQVGPVTFEKLRTQWEEGEVSESTYLWCEGMQNWVRLDQMPVLQDAIAPVALIK